MLAERLSRLGSTCATGYRSQAFSTKLQATPQHADIHVAPPACVEGSCSPRAIEVSRTPFHFHRIESSYAFACELNALLLQKRGNRSTTP